MTFGKRLRALREEKDMSQIELSKELKITSQALSQYELDKRMPDTLMIKKLADFFNVSIDYLLCRSNVRSLDTEDKPVISTKAYHNLDQAGLPEEAIRQIEEYIEFVKQKYNPDGTLKKK